MVSASGEQPIQGERRWYTPRAKVHHTAQQTPSSSTAGGRRGGGRSSLAWSRRACVQLNWATGRLTEIPKDVAEARL